MSNATAQPNLSSQSWKNLSLSVIDFIGSKKNQFLLWLTILIVSQAFVLVPPLLIGHIVDFFLHYQSGSSLYPFYQDVLLLGISSAVAAYVRLLSKNQLGQIDIDVVYRTKVEGFERLMRYPLSWHQQENTGNKMQRLQVGVQSLRQLLHIVHDDLPALIISFVGVLAIFVILDWRFAAFLVIYLAVFSLIEFNFYRKLQHSNHRYNQAAEISSGTYLESAHNVLTIKAMGAVLALKNNLDRAEAEVKHYSYRNHHLITKKWQYFQVINAVALATFLLLVGNSVLHGVMTAGAIFVYFSYYQRLSDSASNGMSTLLSLLEHKTAIERMLAIYDQAPQRRQGLLMPEQWQRIAIEQGGFMFRTTDNHHFTIEGLNFSVRRGEKIGVVGRSGSGKSTLAKLLLGIYPLQQGRITIGEVPLDAIDPNELTKHITIVTQETELFNLSLRDNITLMKEVEPALLQKAIDIACLQPVIDKLPKGIETKVGERGGRLSGGEKQRVGIARAICANTEVLILDEATSALDSKTEILVQHALEKELQGKTLIIIAHRLMTLNQVDRVVVFDKGKIVEQDAFTKLLTNTSSIFHELYRVQHQALAIPQSPLQLDNQTQIYSD